MTRRLKNATFVAWLKSCAKKKDLYNGERLHRDILERKLLENSPYLASSLINMYTKCGEITKAQKVLEELNVREVVSWNALITGYVQQGQGHQAFDSFERMRSEGISADAITFTCMLKACGNIGTIEKGKQIHDEIVSRGLLEKDIVLGNALIDMYAKCQMLSNACKVLQELPYRNVVTWSTLIAGYAQQGHGQEALDCLVAMKSEGISPNVVTFVCLLKACAGIRAIDKGKQIHDEILTRGFLEKNVMLGSALVDMYAKCGVLTRAQQVLEDLPLRNVVCWNALISGYAKHGGFHEALDCFDQMQSEGVSPDTVTFICILKACDKIGAYMDKGRQIHDDIVSRGLLQMDIAVGTALVDMYIKCGALSQANKVLKDLPMRDVISWSALISGYAQQGLGHEALKCFEQMQSEGLSPNVVTLICTLKACGSIGAIERGKQIHEDIVGRCLLEKDTVIGNALVDMYVKCGALTKAQEVLEDLPLRTMVGWSALIAGHVQIGQCHEALNCFEKMQSEGFCLDVVTFICVLKACGDTGAVAKGKKIHLEIVGSGLLNTDIVLGNSLVDMYSKCGVLAEAREALEELLVRDVVSWNALISGYAQQGKAYEALNCFECMHIEGLVPNEVTFLCAMTACSHVGLRGEAEMLLGNMTKMYGIVPSVDHHTCMVAVYGSSGQFEKVMSVIEVIPSYDYPMLWLTLLGACRTWGKVALGRLAFDQFIQLDNSCATAYALMSHIFSASDMQEDAENVEAMRLKYAVPKKL